MRFRLSPFAWVSFAMIVGVMGTALISPLYPLYREAWQLQPSDISLIYVIYMAGALLTLLFLGRLPDRIGFKTVMLWGLALVILGSLLSLFAGQMATLALGRFVVGIASSLITTSSTIGLAQLSRNPDPKRTATEIGFLMAFGFGLGPLLGGLISQWAPWPLVTTYLPTVVLASIGFWALRKTPVAPSGGAREPLVLKDLLPKLTWPEKDRSSAFALTSAVPFLAFGVFSLYAAMSPLFLDRLVPWHGPVVSGTAIAAILLASAGIQLLASRLPTHRCGFYGLLGLCASNLILLANLWLGSGLLFALGLVFTALGHAMSMLAGMSMVGRLAQSHNKAGLFSSYLVIGYLGSMLPLLGTGWMADHWGMDVAVSVFCGLVALAAVIAARAFKNHRWMKPGAGGAPTAAATA